jgi:hypothetical protein
VATTLVGASGVVAAETAADAAEYGPSPIAFFASTLNVYEVPAERPVTVVDAVADTPSVNVVHVEPLLLEY